MNALVIEPDEVQGEVIKIPKSRITQGVGFELTVSVLGRGRYWGRIEERTNDTVLVKILKALPGFNRLDVTLMVGLSRPQTIKKVVAVAVQTGVKKLCFVKTERGEKSYLSAKILNNLEVEVIKSLEQTGDSLAPDIEIYKSLSEFLEEEMRHEGVLFTPYGNLIERINTQSLLCIGPEAGFSESEVAMMNEFKKIKLSDRVLRVEVAVAMAIGKVY